MTKKWKKNRFAGADGVYSTKKYLVREDISKGKNGKTFYSRRYIRKSARAFKEFNEIFSPVGKW